MVEHGRYKKLDVSQRLCQNCNLNLIEDETHFMFQCPAHAADRRKLVSVSSEKCLNFTTLQDNERMNIPRYFCFCLAIEQWKCSGS